MMSLVPVRHPLLALALTVTIAACSPADVQPDTAAATALDSASFAIVRDSAFRALVPEGAAISEIASGLGFTEGPLWISRDGGWLLFSDLRANALMRWVPDSGVTSWRSPSAGSNGNTLDVEGRIVTAQHDGQITRTDADGGVDTLVSAWDGHALSSPNDLVVKSDGTIWFTDPPYGLGDRTQATPGNYVYRFDPATGAVRPVVTDADRPNGLCFAPGEGTLYVADSGEPHHIRAFTVTGDSLSDGRVFAVIEPGAPDGIRCDEHGNVWTSSGDGAQIYASDGALIARIMLPQAAANLAFGGADGTTLYFTARTSLYSMPTLVHDATQRQAR
ncbi:MAG TPA: SMP-30/gluconolactonase/LRE family protein [Gemmatimonadaceae bacterium]|nr:SMP-30/gluconolactonase/LRE family protein [Gemmatimonadaceae bacterium]